MSDPTTVAGHLDQAKAFEQRTLMAADTTMKRMQAMGLLMTAESMRNLLETGLQTARIG